LGDALDDFGDCLEGRMNKAASARAIFPSERVVGICRVLNDGDIIFANLTQLAKYGISKFIVSDMQSQDGTRAEIQRFAALNPDLTVFVVDDPGVNILGSKFFTGLSAFAAISLNATWIIPFDADDFLWLAPNVTLDLSAADIDYILLPWLQVHPSGFETTPIAEVLDGDRPPTVIKLAISPGKMIFRWSEDLVIERGHHWLHSNKSRVLRGVKGEEIGAAMLHFPIRSRDQFLRKIQSGAAAEKRSRGTVHSTHHSALGATLDRQGEAFIASLVDAMWRRDRIGFAALCAERSVDPSQFGYLSDLVLRDRYDFRPPVDSPNWRSLAGAQKTLAFRRKDRETKHKIDLATRLRVALLRMRGYVRVT
jgi:Glycosyl transferase family 2